MPIKLDKSITAESLRKPIERMFDLSAEKILSLRDSWDSSRGTPVFTVNGKYTSRGWTEWTQGFQVGANFIQFDATGDKQFLQHGFDETLRLMPTHVSHFGVHDHGFNNVSTYGSLWRLIAEGKTTPEHNNLCELALKISGAVQAARWTTTATSGGFIYSFNGPHSLFIDTMRSLRSLAVAHQLSHALMGERDSRISLLKRLIDHARNTAQFAIYYGDGRDAYDVRGRTAHESIFNTNDGNYRCPNSQQGYSPFSTWTRGLAWAICGFAEQLEFLQWLPASEFERAGEKKSEILDLFLKPALATADFYLEHACTCGVPVWDTGAPNLHHLGDYSSRPADPYNDWEPVDSSAAAIAAQGFLRLANHLDAREAKSVGSRRASSQRSKQNSAAYRAAGYAITKTLLGDPYLSTDRKHQGLLLHSVYHRPNGWDHIAKGQKIPNGESSMWGDYHLRELALMILKQLRGEPYLQFFLPKRSIDTPHHG